MSEIDRRVLGRLSQATRPDCPPIKVLGDFLDEKIEAERKESIAAHVRSCPACVNRLIELRELARLQHHGPEPGAALLQRVISMVRADTSSTSTIESSPLGGFASIFEWARTLVTDLRFALALGGAATVALVAVVLLHAPRFGSFRTQSQEQIAQDSAGAFAEGVLSKRIAPAIVPVSSASKALNERVLAALESLPKTLVLEQTRGAVNTTVYREAAPATVLVVTDSALGSGVVISRTGTILTNYHVIRGAKRMAVVFKPEHGVDIKKDLAYAAAPTKVDETMDLALLEVAAPERLLHPLQIVGTSKLEVGDDVHAIGHPEGEVWTYTTGTISQIRPRYEWKDADETHRATVIQTQTAINPGNSGGPLLNNEAQVIGINSFRIEGEGLNYAIAGDTVEEFLKSAGGQAVKARNKPGEDITRVERFGDHIVGAYIGSATPPPDTWLVFGSSSDTPEYAVMGVSNRARLDTVFKGVDPKWQEIVYYYDVNCDGVVDLIAYKSAGSDKPDRFQRPEATIRLDSLAGDLLHAFDAGLIPYRQVQICH
jgi:S1-C subfamily serine protease